MEKVLTDYLAAKLLEDLRKNGTLDSDLAVAANSMEIIEKMRPMIRPEDLKLLKKLINQPDYNIARIGVILIRTLQEQIPEIKSFLLKKWNSTTWESREDEFNIKSELMFRLLDYPELDMKTHESIYKYILKNYKKWLKDALRYFTFDNWDGLRKIIANKLNNQSFPHSKAWIYLLVLNAHPDKSKIQSILKKYSKSEHEMVKKVAGDLLNRIDASPKKALSKA